MGRVKRTIKKRPRKKLSEDSRNMSVSEPRPDRKNVMQLAFEDKDYSPGKIVDMAHVKIANSEFLILARETQRIEILETPGFVVRRRILFHSNLVVKRIFAVKKIKEEFDGTRARGVAPKGTRGQQVFESVFDVEIVVVFMNGEVRVYDLFDVNHETQLISVEG